jgi:hypothetical protein
MQRSNIIFMTATSNDENPKYGGISSFKATHHSPDGAELNSLKDVARLVLALRDWSGTNTIVVPDRQTEVAIMAAVPNLDLYRWVSFRDVLIPLALAGEIDEPTLADAALYYKVSAARTHDTLVKCWFAYREQCEMAFVVGKVSKKAMDWVTTKLFGGSQEK